MKLLTSMHEWIKKLWYAHIYIMKYYSTIKNEEILLFVTTWLDLEDIMVIEISQTEKDKTV